MTHFKTFLLALTSVSVSHAVIAQTVTTPFEAQKVAHDLMRLNSGLLFGQNQKFGDIFSRIGSAPSNAMHKRFDEAEQEYQDAHL